MDTSVWAYFGVAAAAYVILKILLETLKCLRLYLWPRIARQPPLTSAYGKWAVITGGSEGIGRGCALELAKRGVNICVVSNAENGITSEITEKHRVECRWINVDFSSTDVYPRIERELSTLEDVGILINNVGICNATYETVSKQSVDFLLKIVNVNVISMVMMTNMIVKHMVKRNKGLIVNVGSITSVTPFPYATAYSSTKSFVETYSCCLAAELSGTNIRVKCLQPWFVRTQLIKGFSKTNDFIGKYFPWTLPDAKTFSASAAATFGCSTPVLYNGYWTHAFIQFVIPYSSLGKAWLAYIAKWCMSAITGDKLYP